MLIKLPSQKSGSDAAPARQTAVSADPFGVRHVHHLRETRTKKILAENMSVSTALRRRISVYGEGGIPPWCDSKHSI